jgi:uncharacterized membrane protein
MESLVQALVGLLFATLTATIGYITPKVKTLIKAHTNAKTAEIATKALDGLTKIAESVVSDFNQRVVYDMKSKQTWTPTLAQKIKADAVTAVKDQGASFIQLSSQSDKEIESLISSLIEQAVTNTKTVTPSQPTSDTTEQK